jgi:hypothetical protein
MRQAGLLALQRARERRKPRPHDGTIIPDAPDRLWGTDATMAYTWATVAKRGDLFAATEPIYDAVRQRFGKVAPDVARGIALRWLGADLDDLRTAVQAFIKSYNTQYLIERHGHKTLREAHAIATQVMAA